MIGLNDDCWCGSGKKWKKCHYPDEGSTVRKMRTQQTMKEEYLKRYDIVLKNEKQIQGIRQACHLASHILDETCKMIREGITTLELNDYANHLHKEAGAIPAPLHYGQP